MAARAKTTEEELADWMPMSYYMLLQQDGSSAGVLCLMADEALLQFTNEERNTYA